MNNPFGDSRQRFSIRKFTVGVASVLLSSAVFGVITANAEQAKEPTGQPATSVLEEANESDGGGQRTNTNSSSQEMTAEPTVQEESTSAISVTAFSSEVVLQEQTVANSEQTSSSQDKASEALSEKSVTASETREASASELATASNSSSTSSDNFGLKITNLSRPIPADVKVTKTGTEINVQNPDVEMEFPNGNSKYATSKVIYYNIPFPVDMTINEGDQVIFNLLEQLRFRTSYDINVYNPENEIVGLAQIDPEKNRVTTTFNNYFKTHLNNKLMSLELETLYSEEIEEGEHLTLDFEGRIIHITVGKVQSLPPGEQVISKWGSQDKQNPTLLNWPMRLNYSRRVFNNLRLIDTWSDNQRFVDGSLQLRYINSADPWIDKGLAMDLIKSFSYDDTHFKLKLNQSDRMVYVWYQTRLTQPVEETNNPANRIKLHADVVSDSYKSTIRLVGGRGDAIGDNLAHFNLELAKELAGRNLKDKEFTFKLLDVTNGGNPVELGETTNDAKGKIVISDLSLSKPGVYHYRVTEVPGNDEDVVYDKLEANITIQVVRETVDNQVKLVAEVAYPEDIIFNNKLVTPAKAKIVLGKELTKAGVKQDLKVDQFQFVLKDRFGKVLETVGNTADGRVTFSKLHFDKSGTYIYTVEEVKGTNEDIVYDGMKATVWITVTRDGDALVSTVANPTDTVFNNYVKEVQPAKAKFELTKVLTGRNLKDGEFSFVLKDDKGNVIQTVINNAQGNISFDNIVYDKPGVYYYTVEEVKGNEVDTVYDNMVAKFQVTVTKTVGEKENLLVAAVLLPLDMEFNYSFIPPTPPVTPKPAKPVVSYEKSGPQLPETGQANDTALLALGVATVMGVAYSHRRCKDV